MHYEEPVVYKIRCKSLTVPMLTSATEYYVTITCVSSLCFDLLSVSWADKDYLYFILFLRSILSLKMFCNHAFIAHKFPAHQICNMKTYVQSKIKCC